MAKYSQNNPIKCLQCHYRMLRFPHIWINTIYILKKHFLSITKPTLKTHHVF